MAGRGQRLARRALPGDAYSTVRYFDRKRCFSADDLADETLTRVARRLEEEKTLTASSPAHYCYIVAKFVFLEHVRQTRIQTAAIESDSSLVATASGVHLTPERPEAEREQTECLETCLEKLASGDRNLILEYYHGEQREKIQSRRELGEKLATYQQCVEHPRLPDSRQTGGVRNQLL